MGHGTNAQQTRACRFNSTDAYEAAGRINASAASGQHWRVHYVQHNCALVVRYDFSNKIVDYL